MDIKSILDKTQETKNVITMIREQEAEVARQEKLNRIIEAVSEKAMKMAESGKVTFGWMANEATRLKDDVKRFLEETPTEFIEDGCAIYFGPTGGDAVATKDFGTYVLSLEKNIEGAHFPRTLKINVRAHTKLAKMLTKRLGIASVSI